jgi:peroxiredoxin
VTLAVLRTGDRAPEFDLPAINRDGRISLADYRGRANVLVGLYRGLHCPFCRRQIALLGRIHGALLEAGVETIGIVNTLPERGRLYFRHNQVPLALAADPDTVVHEAYGVPKPAVTASGSAWPASVTVKELEAARINPTGELPAELPPVEAVAALNKKDGFEPTAADEAVIARHALQLVGHFLIDRAGVVRWTQLEAQASANAIAAFPAPGELLDAARTLRA